MGLRVSSKTPGKWTAIAVQQNAKSLKPQGLRGRIVECQL